MCVATKPATAKCAMCCGHGCEPTLAGGKLDIVPCWWCGGDGEIEVAGPVGDCPACGRQMMACPDGGGGHEAYCPSCTRFAVAGE